VTVIHDVILFFLLLSSKVRKEIIENKKDLDKRREMRKKQV